MDILKGGACIIVLCQHFTLAFANNMLWCDGVFKIKCLAFLFNGNFAVNIFLILSFYLTAKKVFENNISTRDIASMTAKRYLRLAIPITISSFFALVLQKSVGYYNQSVSAIDNNLWLADYYKDGLSIKSFISSSVYGTLWNGDWKFNGPFWMLTLLFMGFFLTLILSFVVKHLRGRYLAILFCCVVFVIYYLQNSMLICSALGVLIATVNLRKSSCVTIVFWKKIVYIIALAILLLVLGFEKDIINFLLTIVRQQSYILQYPFWNGIIAFLFIMICILLFRDNKTIINKNNVALFVGKQSMGIYLFHWPIICSFSSYMYLLFYNSVGIPFLILLFIITFFICLGIAWLYTFFIETRLLKYINNKVDNLFE